jgi:hypothetical protein
MKPLEVDLVKVSHHGSKGNTSPELLSMISSKRFVISTNGAIHSLPDKQCLARIIKAVPDAELYFNFVELIPRIFTKQDRVDFPEFSTVPITVPFEFECLQKAT